MSESDMLMSGSFKKQADLKNQGPVEKMETVIRVANDASQLDRFTNEVEVMKEDVRTMEKLRNRLNEINEESKTIPNAAKMKELRALMDSDIAQVLKLAKSIKKRIETLEFMSSDNIIDQTRISLIMGLGKKLRDLMDEFQGLRAKMAAAHKEIVEYKFDLMTGEKQNLETIENLASRGEFEDHLREAIEEEHGKDRVLDFIEEVRERCEGSKNLQSYLVELHQTFLDVAALVEAYGQQKAYGGGRGNKMARGNSFLKPTGLAHLLEQPDHGDFEMEAKKRATTAMILAVCLFALIIIPLFAAESMREMG